MRGGIEQEPCLSYWRLSYRRKFIRTLWFTTATFPLLVVFQLVGLIPWELRLFRIPNPEVGGWVVIGLFGVSAIAQMIDTYRRWSIGA